jgi:hypothetical protein
MAKAGEFRPAEDRFLEKVVMVPFAGCWLWTGGRVFRLGNKDAPCIEPGRAAFELFVGEIFDLHALNVCGCDGCVNPEHAVLVTRSVKHAEQVRRINRDMTPEEKRQQGARAGRASNAKMTREQIQAKMRKMREAQSPRRNRGNT